MSVMIAEQATTSALLPVYKSLDVVITGVVLGVAALIAGFMASEMRDG